MKSMKVMKEYRRIFTTEDTEDTEKKLQSANFCVERKNSLTDAFS